MLSNAYFLANIRFDTAENEPAKNLQTFCKKKANFAKPLPQPVAARSPAPLSLLHVARCRRSERNSGRGRRRVLPRAAAAPARLPGARGSFLSP